jgi:sugar O-acyltransferase (sialic acid O-acetyltransferase NeuD family)
MKLVIAGAGGHGRVVADAAVASGVYTDVQFLDDRHPNVVLQEGWRVTGVLDDLARLPTANTAFVPAFGDASLRLRILAGAVQLGFECPAVIHPAATVSRFAEIGRGSVVFAGAVVNVGARVGDGCILNTGATIDHDCTLADGVHVCPGAHLAGNVSLGRRTWFGIGAVAKQAITIGDDVIVGAGAVVLEDVSNGSTVLGNPARKKS